jgi:cystathionine beta-lyase
MTDVKAMSTALIHHAYSAPDGFAAPQPGVFKASTVIFPNVAAMQARDWQRKSGYTYGLHGTPTTFVLEERIATLEGGSHTLLVPSGLAGITLVDMALLGRGDEVLIPDNAYERKGIALGCLGCTHHPQIGLIAGDFDDFLIARRQRIPGIQIHNQFDERRLLMPAGKIIMLGDLPETQRLIQ